MHTLNKNWPSAEVPAEWNYHMPVVETWQGLHIAGRVLASLVNIYNSKIPILKLQFLYCIVMVCIGYTKGGGVRRRDADPPPPPPPAAPPLLLLLTLLSEPLMAGAPLEGAAAAAELASGPPPPPWRTAQRWGEYSAAGAAGGARAPERCAAAAFVPLWKFRRALALENGYFDLARRYALDGVSPERAAEDIAWLRVGAYDMLASTLPPFAAVAVHARGAAAAPASSRPRPSLASPPPASPLRDAPPSTPVPHLGDSPPRGCDRSSPRTPSPTSEQAATPPRNRHSSSRGSATRRLHGSDGAWTTPPRRRTVRASQSEGGGGKLAGASMGAYWRLRPAGSEAARTAPPAQTEDDAKLECGVLETCAGITGADFGHDDVAEVAVAAQTSVTEPRSSEAADDAAPRCTVDGGLEFAADDALLDGGDGGKENAVRQSGAVHVVAAVCVSGEAASVGDAAEEQQAGTCEKECRQNAEE